MLRLSKRLEPSYEYDLIPLIDMLFILLIFFVLAAAFAVRGLEVDLPPARSSKALSGRGGGAAPGGGRRHFLRRAAPAAPRGSGQAARNRARIPQSARSAGAGGRTPGARGRTDFFGG